MPFKDLRDFMTLADRKGQLRRITAEVDPYLEIGEICDRVSKGAAPSALLFEAPVSRTTGKRFDMPVAINLFGSYERMAWALGVDADNPLLSRDPNLFTVSAQPLPGKGTEEVLKALDDEVARLHENGIRLRIVGDLSRFEPRLRELIEVGERRTADNSRLTLTIAANYGGRWDILQATNRLANEQPERCGQWTEADLAPYLAMAYAPEPDLFIRTGGEQRISNFMIWQLAYTELYFTDRLWPEFDAKTLDAAIASYRRRERRFGRTSEQLQSVPSLRPAEQSLSQAQDA